MSYQVKPMGKKFIAICTLLVVIVCAPAAPIFADEIERHEDPDAASQIFNEISLLRYYSDSLDTILQKQPQETENALEIMPFANIPEDLSGATSDFSDYGIALSYSVYEIDLLWHSEAELLNRFLLDDAENLRDEIIDSLPKAYDEYQQLFYTVESIGAYLSIGEISSQSDLKTLYNEIIDKLNRIESMLDLFNRPLIDPGHNEDYLPTALSLTIVENEAFVGDEINITLKLTSNDAPLPDRTVILALNGAHYQTVNTDQQGYYQGQLALPYWYMPEIEIQAVYYPEGQDIGVYLGATSPISTLKLKYYTANLNLSVEGHIYPGQSPMLYGSLNYKDSPVLNDRSFNVYLEDELIDNIIFSTSFESSIKLPTDIELGRHTIIVSSAASGRYAPVISYYNINVTQAEVFLDLVLPNISVIPGSIKLNGELYSEIGPLDNAFITFEINEKITQVYGSGDGTFSGQIKKGMEISLLGYQQINVQIQPAEPWNAPLEKTFNIYVINIANLGIILAVLIIITVILRLNIRKRSRFYSKPIFGNIEDSPPVPISLIKSGTDKDTIILWKKQPKDGIFINIVEWYARTLKLIEKITAAILKPHQTLREYAEENSPKLGLLNKLFLDFTLFVEKILYSDHKPTEEDAAVSRRFSDSIRNERL